MSSGFNLGHSPRRRETEHGAYCSSPTDAVAERAQQHASHKNHQSIQKGTPIRGDTSINIATAFHQQQMLDDTPLTKRLRPVQLSPQWSDRFTKISKEHWSSINTNNNHNNNTQNHNNAITSASQDQEIDAFFGHSNTPQQSQSLSQSLSTPEGWNPYEEEEMLSQHPEEEARRRNVVASGGEILDIDGIDYNGEPARTNKKSQAKQDRDEDDGEDEYDQYDDNQNPGEFESINPDEDQDEQYNDDSDLEGVAWMKSKLAKVYDKVLLMVFVRLFWCLWIVKEIISRCTELLLLIAGRAIIQPFTNLLKALGIYNPCPEPPLRSSWRWNRLVLFILILAGALNGLLSSFPDNQFERTPIIRHVLDNQPIRIDKFRTIWPFFHKKPFLAEFNTNKSKSKTSTESIPSPSPSPLVIQDPDSIQAYISKEVERQVQSRLHQVQSNSRPTIATVATVTDATVTDATTASVGAATIPATTIATAELHSYIDNRCASRTELEDYAAALDHVRQEINDQLRSTLQDIPAQVERETDQLRASLEVANYLQNHWEEVQKLLDNIGNNPQLLSSSSSPSSPSQDQQHYNQQQVRQRPVPLNPWDTLPDYALATSGASVIGRLTSYTYTTYPQHPALRQIARLTGIGARNYYAPVVALMHGTEPGACWTMSGAQGTLGIHLSQPILVKHVTVEFPPPTSSTVNRTTSPREFEVWGLQSIGGSQTKNSGSSLLGGVFGPVRFPWDYPNPDSTLLGSFEYDIEGAPIQMFDVPSTHYLIAQAVLIRIRSNWGHPDYTSLYRVRIHGYPEE
ncbi:hypothetical protein F4703DRAFT_1860686 [Phycomyces blakesleeanus]